MSVLPENAKKIDVAGSTLDFFEYEKENITYFFFDSSMTGPPEPMVNAMAGLRLLDAKNKKLQMLNHKTPGGLFAKIGDAFDFEIQEVEGGKSLVTFSFKNDASLNADLTQTSCDG
ncbi:MAG: hypothetical protein WC149_06100 [Arcobacteraceae bacterium]